MHLQESCRFLLFYFILLYGIWGMGWGAPREEVPRGMSPHSLSTPSQPAAAIFCGLTRPSAQDPWDPEMTACHATGDGSRHYRLNDSLGKRGPSGGSDAARTVLELLTTLQISLYFPQGMRCDSPTIPHGTK